LLVCSLLSLSLLSTYCEKKCFGLEYLYLILVAADVCVLLLLRLLRLLEVVVVVQKEEKKKKKN